MTTRDVSDEPVTQLELYQALDQLAKGVNAAVNEALATLTKQVHDALAAIAKGQVSAEDVKRVSDLANFVTQGVTVERFLRDDDNNLTGKISLGGRR